MPEPTPLDRLLDSFRKLVRAEDPARTFLGTYEYQVHASDGTTADLTPTDTTISLPPLVRIPLRSGVSGVSVHPSSGSLVGVKFLNGDPSRPIVDGACDGTKAQQIDINGSSPSAARTGDAVDAGYLVFTSAGIPAPSPYFPGGTIGAAAAALYASSLSPPGQVVAMVAGVITGGSSTVNIG